MYKTALKLFETIKCIDWGQHVKLFRRRGSHLRFPSIIPFCYRRDIQKQLSRGGLLGWRKWTVGRWPGWCSDRAPRQPVYFSLSQGEHSLGEQLRALQCTLRIRILEVYLALVHFAHKGSEEGQSTTDPQSTDPSGDPRGYPSLETPLLGKGRQCSLASPCPLQGGGLSCWAKEEALAKEQLLPDRWQEWGNTSKLGKAHRVKG